MKKIRKNIIKKFVPETTVKVISEQKRSEEALTSSASFLNSIIDQSPHPMWISDNKGTLLRINKACLNLLHISEDEVIGKYNVFEDNIVEEQGYLPLIRRVFEDGDTVKFELKYETSKLKRFDLKDSAFVILEVAIFPIRNKDGKITNAVIQHLDITERRRTEDALRSSEERYKQLLGSVTDYIYTIKIEGDGSITTKHGPGCIAVTGYSPHEYEADQLLWHRMIYEDDRPAISEQNANIFLGEEAHCVEHRIYHKNGTIRWVRNTPVPRRDADGQLIGYDGLISDITDQKHVEEALSESENRFRKIFEEAHIGIVMVSRSFAFEKVNPAFCRMMGYSEDELYSMTFADITHSNHLRQDLDNVNKVMRGEMPFYQTEKRYIHKSGKVIWADLIVSCIRDEHGELVHFLSMINDITERKHAEEALRVSEEKYRDIFERAVEGIFQSNTKGKFLNVNPAFASMLGYESPMELITGISNIRNQLFVRPEDADYFMSSFKKSGTILGFEHELYKKDGSKIWIYVSARAEKNKIGKIIYYEGISENISKRKQDEEEKEKLHSQLRQAQKMEALGTFVGGIAHDFNNILSIIIGYATLLNMELEKNNPLHSYTDLILSSSEKAANLTQGLLAFSRKQPIDLKPLKLNDVIKGTEKILKRLLTEDIILKKNFTKESTDIVGDPSQIDQILFNLATNARDAMPKGGKLIIETKIMEMDKDFMDFTGYGKTGKFVLLSVSDTGTGIDNKNKEHIFDPFFTTKEVGKGTGLGLSTVYGIVKQHNGYINVYSELNIGTSFNIYFPYAKGKAKIKKKTIPKIRHGKEKVLIAEDNEGVRSLIKRILTKYGYKIIEAVDGEDAIEKFRRNKGVELIIIDSVMPKKNGREVYNEIIKINPGIKVLFTSGYTRDVVLDKGVEEKEFDFISKPVTPKKLLYKLGEILDRK